MITQIKNRMAEMSMTGKQLSDNRMMVWCFMSISTLFKSYGDNGRLIIKGSVQ